MKTHDKIKLIKYMKKLLIKIGKITLTAIVSLSTIITGINSYYIHFKKAESIILTELQENHYNDTISLIKKHEGVRNKVYNDATGKNIKFEDINGNLTIGAGLNIMPNSFTLTDEMVDKLLLEKIKENEIEIHNKYKWVKHSPDKVKIVINDMVYNMGFDGFSKFKTSISYIKEGNYKLAGDSLLKSKWCKQVKSRCLENIKILNS